MLSLPDTSPTAGGGWSLGVGGEGGGGGLLRNQTDSGSMGFGCLLG